MKNTSTCTKTAETANWMRLKSLYYQIMQSLCSCFEFFDQVYREMYFIKHFFKYCFRQLPEGNTFFDFFNRYKRKLLIAYHSCIRLNDIDVFSSAMGGQAKIHASSRSSYFRSFFL